MNFTADHFAKFSSITEVAAWNRARRVRSWARQARATAEDIGDLPDEGLSRQQVFDICADSSRSPEQCFLAIMAWGGMKADHGEAAWAARAGWRSIMEDLRAGAVGREEAYERFWDFRKGSPRCGMGPAYYTKAIFFAHPAHDGYIMDQWTSLSVNLLTDTRSEPLIKLARGVSRGRRYHRVADSNPAATYEAFCMAVEELAALLPPQTPEQIEQRLFSSGGSKPGCWRKYVIEKTREKQAATAAAP